MRAPARTLLLKPECVPPPPYVNRLLFAFSRHLRPGITSDFQSEMRQRLPNWVGPNSHFLL
jgi:hypothetical protein